MDVSEIQAKGLSKLLAVTGTVPDKLKMHISVLESGQGSHSPHTHAGVEGFYVFEGNVTVDFEGKFFPLGANEAMVVDATRPHTLFNSGTTKTKYLVVIAQ